MMMLTVTKDSAIRVAHSSHIVIEKICVIFFYAAHDDDDELRLKVSKNE